MDVGGWLRNLGLGDMSLAFITELYRHRCAVGADRRRSRKARESRSATEND